MIKNPNKKEYCFLSLYEKFIDDNKKGKRLQPNGKKLTEGTIANYTNTFLLLKDFSAQKKFKLKISSIKRLSARETETEKNYWKKFYKKFSDYLYNEVDCYDNYAGQCFKNIKVFFSYLNKEMAILTGSFHKLFYIRKEQVQIFPLMPEELNFLIYNKQFEDRLPKKMREVKDVFVFGCTVALRVSDLINLQKANLRVTNNHHYLCVRSIKTSTDTLIKLPAYAIEIILKYKKIKKKLLPHFNASNLNQYIKFLLEQAGMTNEVLITRERRGVAVKQFNHGKPFRFCDVSSTHTMRRTAITTMLSLGMPEQLVRKISGHSPNGKEFYRYVLWAQTYQDKESEKMFEKLKLAE
jgi:integrase